MKKLYVFPGQGAQKMGMLSEVPERFLRSLSELLSSKCYEKPEFYQSTIGIQLAIYVKEVAEHSQLITAGYVPDMVAGHSIGAYAAAVACEALTFETGLELVYYRASLMAEAYPKGYGMGVVSGMRKNQLAEIVKRYHTEAAPVYLSNQNSPLQLTLSGKLTAIEKVISVAKISGASKGQMLNVPVPSHCPLMSRVSQQLQERLAEVSFSDPRCLYLANHTGKGVRTAQEIATDLAVNVEFPVLWDRMLDIALEYQPDIAIEMSPGNALSKLIKEKETSLKQITISQVGIDGSLFLLKKWEGR